MALHTSVWDGCPLWAWGQGAETWGWEGGPRKAPAVDCEETTWGVGNEELCKQECSWRKLRPPQRGSTIVEWCAFLLMCQPLPPWALWRAHPPPPEPEHVSLLSPLLHSSLLLPGQHAHPNHWLPCLMGSCAMPNSGADSGGRNKYRGGAEATAETQGPCDWEEELNTLLATPQTMELHLHWWFPKSSVCKTSKRAVSVPATGMDLVLVSVGFMVTYKQDFGQARAWTAPTASREGPGVWLPKSWNLTAVDLHK